MKMKSVHGMTGRIIRCLMFVQMIIVNVIRELHVKVLRMYLRPFVQRKDWSWFSTTKYVMLAFQNVVVV